MYIRRNLSKKILKYLDKPEIIAVVGPRQCGKTTLLKKIAESLTGCLMISFEDRAILSMFENNIDDFIKLYVSGKKYLFIDEFQYAKEGGKKLKYIFDTKKIKLIISGSSNIDLTVNALKFLVGRIFIFNLYPLDFYEFLSYKADNYLNYWQDLNSKFWKQKEFKAGKEVHEILLKNYEEYLLYGGYPRVVIANDPEEKKEVLKNIYNTYFLREVKDILGLIDDYKLDRLVKALALQIGNMIEYKELSLVSEYGYLTLKKYLNFLEKTFICYLIKPFYNNKRTEIVKNPKVFFCDTGLRNAVVNDFRALSDRPDEGAILENGIFQQLIKGNISCNYWRDKQQHEIDFILNLEGGKSLALEVKKLARDIRSSSLENFKKTYPNIEKIILYKNKIEEVKVKNYPLYVV